jgi:hypothetical protein
VLNTYYLYDGYILTAEISLKRAVDSAGLAVALNPNDTFNVCIQRDPADETLMTCARVMGPTNTAMDASNYIAESFIANTPLELCDTAAFYSKTTNPISAKSNGSLWIDRQCNSANDNNDGTIGCWGQEFYDANNGIDFVWRIWQWQATLESSGTDSGFRHLKNTPYFAGVMQYDAANANYVARFGSITLMGASHVLAASAAMSVALIASMF